MSNTHSSNNDERKWGKRDPRPPQRRTRGGRCFDHMTAEEVRDYKASEYDRMVASGEIETVETIKTVAFSEL